MKTWAVLLSATFLSILIAGCATAPPPNAAPSQLFDDRAFAPATQRISVADVFALSPEMQRYLDTDIAEQMNAKGGQQGLFDALYDKGQLRLDYDAAMTRNAAQAFAARSGNCLSLVIMTAAFAKAAHLPVRYQTVVVDDTWSRDGNLTFLIGHVNLTLGTVRTGISLHNKNNDDLTIDFLAPHETRGLHTRPISEQTIVAMYMNNRAAEVLTQGNLNDAYWFARAAIEQDPGFVSAYNTLGIVYRRHGSPANAERVFAHALEREPNNTRVMSNLASVLTELGRTAEAAAIARRLAALEPDPPFRNFNDGLAAMRKGDYRAARDFFAKEVDRTPSYHEFHFWLAVACMRLGDYDQARRQLTIAMETSPSRNEQAIYAAKLDRIKTNAAH